ncbi:DUF6518 family protein [Paramicrobacterium fandaimingii]|uniref:DUF6518 family protein n=1 Tax=Paramicrobacterium fandaimingii TaxID=2708079 RepID=UPI001420AECA|nr:DUF6518 family protein [Microbacterium fandaimingii]
MTTRRRGTLSSIAAVLATSLVLGGLTSYAQGFLPDWFSSFANSASGWTLLTAVLVFLARCSWWVSALLGAGSFVLLTLGYAAVSTLRGFVYDPTFFAIIGLIAGPFIGLAACWIRRRDLRAAAATAVLAGIGAGEAVYGLTVVGDTTSPVYWVFIGAVALALAVFMLARRVRRALLPITVVLVGTALVAAAFTVAFSLL